jgi:hypothetical protein
LQLETNPTPDADSEEILSVHQVEAPQYQPKLMMGHKGISFVDERKPRIAM